MNVPTHRRTGADRRRIAKIIIEMRDKHGIEWATISRRFGYVDGEVSRVLYDRYKGAIDGKDLL